MRKYVLVAFVTTAVIPAFAQEEIILKGKIKADALEETTIHIINITKKTGTVNAASGDFQISVQENDTLLFSSIQYENLEVLISRDILQNPPLNRRTHRGCQCAK